MPEVGQIHRNEYELASDRSIPVIIGEAPGRIHFLGQDNEPEDGLFLSAAIDRYIKLAISPRKDNSFRFYAFDLAERKRSTIANMKYKKEDRWANYLKSVISIFIKMGIPMRGMNISFCGDIPQQTALASSTAIETAAAVALRGLLHVQLSDLELAEKLYHGHNGFFSNKAHFSDYLTLLLARKDHFLLVDAAKAEVKKIKAPLSRFNIMIVDSRVPRLGIESELESRRRDALKGRKLLSRLKDGAGFRDLASADLLEVLGDFPEVIRRRSIHMVEEIQRVYDAYDALERKDLASLSKIIFHSHESLRDYYETSCPEVDWLVKRAQELEGVAGARMTGHGFGGCTYIIIRRELAGEYKRRLEDYERIFGFRPVIYDIKISGVARVVQEKNGER
jgi:galactokinase